MNKEFVSYVDDDLLDEVSAAAMDYGLDEDEAAIFSLSALVLGDLADEDRTYIENNRELAFLRKLQELKTSKIYLTLPIVFSIISIALIWLFLVPLVFGVSALPDIFQLALIDLDYILLAILTVSPILLSVAFHIFHIIYLEEKAIKWVNERSFVLEFSEDDTLEHFSEEPNELYEALVEVCGGIESPLLFRNALDEALGHKVDVVMAKGKNEEDLILIRGWNNED